MEDLTENQPDRVKVVKKAKVTKMLKDGEKVIGVEYEKDGKQVSRAPIRLHPDSGGSCMRS